MKAYVALLRAVNVGGTGKLAMSDLKSICEELGFAQVRTYIASGNVVFASSDSEAKVKSALEAQLKARAGKPVGVLVRTAAEMAAIVENIPFPDKAGNKTVAIFLDQAPPKDAASSATHQTHEEISLGKREIYVHYPDGMGHSKLKLSASQTGTARNLNTIKKLAQLAAELTG